MKTLFLAGILLSFSVWAETSKEKLQQFMKRPTVSAFKKLEESFEERIEALELQTLIGWEKPTKDNLFLDAMKVYFPHLLPEKFPGRTIYLSCFPKLYALTKKLTNKKNFKDYRACLEGQFGNDLPVNYRELLDALEKLGK